MAGHAGGAGRHTGEGGFFDAGVAITAIDPKTGDVMLMAERYRLVDWHTDLRLPRRIVEPIQTEQGSDQQEGDQDQNGSEKRICTWRKYLGHSRTDIPRIDIVSDKDVPVADASFLGIFAERQ